MPTGVKLREQGTSAKKTKKKNKKTCVSVCVCQFMSFLFVPTHIAWSHKCKSATSLPCCPQSSCNTTLFDAPAHGHFSWTGWQRQSLAAFWPMWSASLRAPAGSYFYSSSFLWLSNSLSMSSLTRRGPPHAAQLILHVMGEVKFRRQLSRRWFFFQNIWISIKGLAFL